MDPSQFVIVLSTFPVDEDAATLARTLVSERLAACVNVLPPMPSIYRWEGNVEEVSEHQLIIKTVGHRLDALKRRLNELHPYDVPECLVISVADGGTAYLEWVKQALE
jgi:periplasmic divalent cation tolerance protein